MSKVMFRNWNLLQGYGDVSDEIVYTRRDINSRKISIENSGYSEVLFTISPYYDKIGVNYKKLKPHEVFYAAVNTVDDEPQYIFLISTKDKKVIGGPFQIRSDANQYVIRQGLNKWYIQPFQQSFFK